MPDLCVKYESKISSDQWTLPIDNENHLASLREAILQMQSDVNVSLTLEMKKEAVLTTTKQ